jgi:hypothetical protein
MTIMDQRVQNFDMLGTTRAGPLTVIAALQIALICNVQLDPTSLAQELPAPEVEVRSTPSTGRPDHSVSETDLVQKLTTLVQELVANQKALDADAQETLHRNLWDLYV